MANLWKALETSRRLREELEKSRRLAEIAGRTSEEPPPVKPVPKPSVDELKQRGLVRLTVSYMREEWGIGNDPLGEMAERAVADDRIHPDYWIVVPRGAKQSQLWARLKG
jgi:hypothetical protein